MFYRKYAVEIAVIVFSSLFSFWLMFHTFSYSDGTMYIAIKAWSDFASHIPLIRSFSLGDNFPPEFPLFPGEPIRYHFLFYALVGFLERLGLQIDYALNIPSALSIALLMIMIYLLGRQLFKSKVVGLLSVVFFLFNGSLSFIEFFKAHPLSFNTINDIFTNTTFPSFGPYDGKIVSAFWNLNIYTNQRHLALPMAALLLITLLIVQFEKKGIALPFKVALIFGVLVGILPFAHSSLFIMAIAVLLILFFILPKQRLPLFIVLTIAGLVSLPRIVFLGTTATFIPHIKIGYLIVGSLSFEIFLSYWIANIGIAFFLIPIGFFLAPSLAKKVLLSFLPLFLIGNLIQFSPEIAANHKFFNMFLIVGNSFAAYAILRIWQLHKLGRAIVPLLLFLMILSGIIDFSPIYNDAKIALADYPKNEDVSWIMENTPKDAAFLNSSYLYHPASLAGRKIFLGWPYFAWSQGYDTNTRDMLRKDLFSADTKEEFCLNVGMHKLSYVSIESQVEGVDFPVNRSFFEKNLASVYKSNRGLTIYATEPFC